MILLLTPSLPEQAYIGKKWGWGFSSQPLGKATTVLPGILGSEYPSLPWSKCKCGAAQAAKPGGSLGRGSSLVQERVSASPHQNCGSGTPVPCPDHMNSACPPTKILGVPCSRETNALKAGCLHCNLLHSPLIHIFFSAFSHHVFPLNRSSKVILVQYLIIQKETTGWCDISVGYNPKFHICLF